MNARLEPAASESRRLILGLLRGAHMLYALGPSSPRRPVVVVLLPDLRTLHVRAALVSPPTTSAAAAAATDNAVAGGTGSVLFADVLPGGELLTALRVSDIAALQLGGGGAEGPSILLHGEGAPPAWKVELIAPDALAQQDWVTGLVLVHGLLPVLPHATR
jgi:hypothetical protein